MPYVPPKPYARPLAEALDFIQDQDQCTRPAAFEQLRQMAIDDVVRLLWADRKPAPRSSYGVTQAIEHVGPYPRDWNRARLVRGDRVRFNRFGTRSVLVAWPYFQIAREAHQPKEALKAKFIEISPSPEQAPLASSDTVPGVPQKYRYGPAPGTLRRYDEHDRALFPQIDQLRLEGKSVEGAARELAYHGKVKGNGTEENKGRRVARLYRAERIPR